MSDTLIRLTGLYEHTSRAGQTYLTGRLNRGTRLVAFRNNNKQGQTDPDWHLFIRAEAKDKESETDP